MHSEMSGSATLFSFHTKQKMKFSIKDFFGKYDQIHRKLWIWSYLLKKSSIGNVVFSANSFVQIRQ